MTAEDVANWKIERDIARESGQPELMQKAYDHRDDLMMHCIQRQADRVKKLIANDERTENEIGAMKTDICDIKSKVSQHEHVVSAIKDGKSQAKGFWLAIKILAWASATLGSGVVGYFLRTVHQISTAQ